MEAYHSLLVILFGIFPEVLEYILADIELEFVADGMAHELHPAAHPVLVLPRLLGLLLAVGLGSHDLPLGALCLQLGDPVDCGQGPHAVQVGLVDEAGDLVEGDPGQPLQVVVLTHHEQVEPVEHAEAARHDRVVMLQVLQQHGHQPAELPGWPVPRRRLKLEQVLEEWAAGLCQRQVGVPARTARLHCQHIRRVVMGRVPSAYQLLPMLRRQLDHALLALFAEVGRKGHPLQAEQALCVRLLCFGGFELVEAEGEVEPGIDLLEGFGGLLECYSFQLL